MKGRTVRIERFLTLWWGFCAGASVLLILVTAIYLLGEGMPLILETGPARFLFGTEWEPLSKTPRFGIFAMLAASVWATAASVALSYLLGVLTAVCAKMLCPRWVSELILGLSELLLAVPSVVFGLVGMFCLAPAAAAVFREQMGASGGAALLSVILLLTVMLLPGMISRSAGALGAVPTPLAEASFALGAGRAQTAVHLILPAASSGIAAAVVAAAAQAVGESAAVVMVCGNVAQMPRLFSGVRPLTAAIVTEMGYAAGRHRAALFGIGIVLLALALLLGRLLALILVPGRRLGRERLTRMEHAGRRRG